MLLQIAEPGNKTQSQSPRLAVGIDLGTTHSLVATVRESRVVVLDDVEGRPLLPSVVRYLADGRVEVGHAAKRRQNEDPETPLSPSNATWGEL